MAAFVICVFDDVVVDAAAVVAVVAADAVVEAVEGGCRRAVAADVVADVSRGRQTAGRLQCCSSRCIRREHCLGALNTNKRTHARWR